MKNFFRRLHDGSRNARRLASLRRRTVFEPLEERAMLVGHLYVGSSEATGANTLREMITLTNANLSGTGVIENFEIGFEAANAPYDIDLGTNTLPVILQGTKIIAEDRNGNPVSVTIRTSAVGAARPDYAFDFDIQNRPRTVAISGVEGIEIKNFEHAGIRVRNGLDGTVTFVSNSIHDNGSLLNDDGGIRIENRATYSIHDNQIYANNGSGISIAAGTPFDDTNDIYHNWIGTNSALASGLGNKANGIYLEQIAGGPKAENWTIIDNWIWNNGTSADDDGIELDNCGNGNYISNNNFLNNVGVPIDLIGGGNREGRDGNDLPDDGDGGPNNGLNSPVITHLMLEDGIWTIMGNINANSTTNKSHNVYLEFYKYTEPKRYEWISVFSESLDVNGDRNWSIALRDGSLPDRIQAGDQIAVLLIDRNTRETSEMSLPTVVPTMNEAVGITAAQFYSPNDRDFSVEYQISGVGTPFNLGVYRIIGTTETLVQQVPVEGTFLQTGGHILTFAPNSAFDAANDPVEDYTLLVKLDNTNVITETDETNNSTAFSYGLFVSPMQTVHAYGSSIADEINLFLRAEDGVLTAQIYPQDQGLPPRGTYYVGYNITAIHVHSHGGSDTINRAAIDAVMSVWGGDGDDALTIDGAPTMPTAVSKFDPGTGTNTLSVNSGKVYLDTPWNDVSDPLWALATTVKGGAELQTDRLWQTTLTITESSKLTFTRDNSFENPASKLNSLAIDSGSTLDIADQALIIDYTGTSPLAAIRDLILSGRGGSGTNPTWTGTGITSGTAATLDRFKYSVAYAENSALPLGALAIFRDVAVDSTCILICYTRTADATLDGVVDNNDVTVINSYYDPSDPNPYWYFGDFDFDGYIENDDVTFLNAYYDPTALPA